MNKRRTSIFSVLILLFSGTQAFGVSLFTGCQVKDLVVRVDSLVSVHLMNCQSIQGIESHDQVDKKNPKVVLTLTSAPANSLNKDIVGGLISDQYIMQRQVIQHSMIVSLLTEALANKFSVNFETELLPSERAPDELRKYFEIRSVMLTQK